VMEVPLDKLRPHLLSLAYRITGSRSDAEDIVQETALRWLRADRNDIRSPRAFLTTIATRLSLNHLRNRRARREDYRGDWLPEPADTCSDERDARLDAISFGFLTLLERLTPLQRAVFVLRSAFDCDYTEIAAIVGRDQAACRKTFSRAKAAVMLARSPKAVPESVHDALLAKFLEAAESGDIMELGSMLADNVVIRGDGGPGSPGLKKPLRGRHAVAQFIVASRALLPEGATFSLERLNGALAALFRVRGVHVLAILIECTEDRKIGRVFAIANPEKLKAIGAP
jgi:RNA polymerase sigma-70 factor, ECF subfamily